MNLILPKIVKVKLSEYSPLFEEEIDFELNELFILLGGNGLGKTTILQSVIYGIAGPANSQIEAETIDRWNRDYFKERLSTPNNASIEVWFKLGNDRIKLKRGFNSDSILEFELNDETITSKKSEASNFFEQYLTELAGYNDLQDFNYIVHNLCYLSEKRESLVWNIDIQTRLLMRIVSDADLELDFDNKRKLLKMIDSKERHLGVEYNNLAKRIKEAESVVSKAESEDQSSKVPKKNVKSIETDIEKLQDKILKLKNVISTDKEILTENETYHSSLSKQIEDLREKINKVERNFFFKHLRGIESDESKLAIYKLITNALCPSCGNISEELQTIAKKNLKEKKCVLCGTDDVIEVDELELDYNTRLSKLLEEKIRAEQVILDIEKRINPARAEVLSMELKLNELLLKQKPTIIYVNKRESDVVTKADIENLKKALKAVAQNRKSKQIEFKKLQEDLESSYSEFNRINDQRISELSELYRNYASEFLGAECTLEKGPSSNDNFIDIRLLVPKFNGILRTNQDSCSEAQRFFLDIALRMSLIQLSNSISQENSTFICETPESALDITYVNNVSDMFKSFSFNNGNSILMSSNIQAGGITQSLLSEIKSIEKKKEYFLNMIEVGNLSDVQASETGKQLFKEEIEKILKN